MVDLYFITQVKICFESSDVEAIEIFFKELELPEKCKNNLKTYVDDFRACYEKHGKDKHYLMYEKGRKHFITLTKKTYMQAINCGNKNTYSKIEFSVLSGSTLFDLFIQSLQYLINQGFLDD